MRHLLWISMILLAVLAGCKKDKPPMLANLSTSAATSITANTAQIGANIVSNGGDPITKSGVCWAIHSGPTVGDSITTDGVLSGQYTSSLNNLACNTTYYVKAYAINAIGTGYGNEVNFTTSKGLATLSTVAISNSVALSATSGGNIISDGGYSVTARGVCWSATPHPTIANFSTVDGTGTGTYASTLTPLASQTMYYVRAYATTSFGTAYGNELAFSAASSASVADIDGNVYSYITIGTQTWMTSNLKTTHYQNGDPIINGSTGFNWDSGDSVGAYAFVNGDSTTNKTYGKLYSLGAVRDSRNICPAGWHIPTDAEWQTLEIYEGMSPADANTIADRGTIGGKLFVGGSSGLNFQNVGYLYYSSPTVTYYGFGQYGAYFTATAVTSEGNYDRWINDVSGDPGPIGRFYDGLDYGEAVRCVKN